jgi:hypothetical protein
MSRNYKMTVRLYIIIFLLTPFVLFGQTNGAGLKEGLSKDIYSIIKTVIKKEKLNKNYVPVLTPEKSCNINQADTTYLQTLLIKPKPVDTVNKTSSSGFVVASNFTYPDKNILTSADIAYILETKENFKNFR